MENQNFELETFSSKEAPHSRVERAEIPSAENSHAASLPGVEDFNFWTFAEHAKDRFDLLWPGINADASFLVMMLYRATDVILFDVRQIQNDFGLSFVGQRVLYVLAICGPLPMLRLAELTGMSKAACSSCVRTLLAERYVSRTRSEDDGRSYIISLTQTGFSVAEKTFRDRNARESRWLKALNQQEIKQLHEILEKMMTFASSNAEIRDSL